jgi:hypothetical protein
MSATSALRRVRRFLPAAARSLRRDAAPSLRDAASSLRRVAHNVRTAWLVSDERYMEKLLADLTAQREDPQWRAAREQAERARMQRRERLLAEGRAVYEGEVYAKPASRGVVLTGLDRRPHVDDWLVDVLGLDDYWSGGDSCDVRLVVEPLPSRDAAAPAATSVSFEGFVHLRPGGRGIVLEDDPEAPELSEWVGRWLDDETGSIPHGTSRRVRIHVQFLGPPGSEPPQ